MLDLLICVRKLRIIRQIFKHWIANRSQQARIFVFIGLRVFATWVPDFMLRSDHKKLEMYAGWS